MVNTMNRREFIRQSSRIALGTATVLAQQNLAADTKKSLRGPAAGPLKVHPDNPRYFTDGTGKAVYLTGSHTWSNVADMGPTDPPEPFDFSGCLDWTERLDHNFIRLWAWETTSWDTSSVRSIPHKATLTVTPHPFARTGPGLALDGKPKFDLTKYDAEYFRRLRSRATAAGQRGIYVSIMLFEGWALQHAPGAWRSHPFNPKNNVNRIDGDADADGLGVEIHTLTNPQVTALGEAYVRKVVDTVNDLDNVLYEISNENHGHSTDWQYHVIDFIHRYERGKPKQHPVGMTFQYKGGSNRNLFDSPADWISPNREGGYRDNPPAADGSKVILTDTDHLWGIGGNRAWVWKSFLRGLNPIFMDPYDGVVLGSSFDPQWDPIRQSMGHTLKLARQMNLAAAVPKPMLASTGYCLASTTGSPSEYLVYLPDGGEVSVDLSAASGRLQVRWVRPADGTLEATGTTANGSRRKFTAPFPGDAVLWLKGV